MKRSIFELTIGWLLAVIFVGIVLHAPFSVFFGTLLPDFSLVLKAWKEVLMLLALILMVIYVSRHHLWRKIVGDKLLWIIAGYSALHLLLLAFGGTLQQLLAGLMIDLRFLCFFVLVYVYVQIFPSWIPLFKKLLIAGAVIVIGFGVLQLLLPRDILAHIGYGPQTIMPYLTVDQNPNFVRINSTTRGPNSLGAYSAIVISVAAAWLLSRERKTEKWEKLLVGSVILLSAVTLYVSYSRSAWIAAIIGVAIAIYFSVNYHKRKLFTLVSLGVIGLCIGLFALFGGGRIVSTVLLHEDPLETGQVNSNDDHAKSLVQGAGLMISQPLGAGIGSTGSPSLTTNSPLIIENYYLYVAHESGWLGLGLYLTITAMVLVRLWRQRQDSWALGVFSAGIGLAIMSLLLPIFTDDTVSIIWWGAAALVLVMSEKKGARHAGNDSTK